MKDDLEKATSVKFVRSCRRLCLLEDYKYDVIISAFRLSIPPENIRDVYIGRFDSDEDFIYHILQSNNIIITKQSKYIRIDWASTKRLIFQDYYDWNKHYFKR